MRPVANYGLRPWPNFSLGLMMVVAPRSVGFNDSAGERAGHHEIVAGGTLGPGYLFRG